MIRWIVGTSLRSRLPLTAVAVALIAVGIVRLGSFPVEALPEFMPTRVEVQTEAIGLSAEEVENLITNPMEQEFFNGMPWLDKIRSDSIPGLSSVEMIFEPGTDPMRARQVVQERLTMTPALPEVSKPPFVIQHVSSTSRLMMIGISSRELSLIDLSVLAHWTIRPRLLAVPGVANVSIWGLRDRQLQVRVDPQRLQRHGVTLDQIIATTGHALWASRLTFLEASTPGTGGFVDTANQRIEIQHTSPVKTAKDLAQVAVEGDLRRPLRLGDVAQVVEDHQPLVGDAMDEGAPGLMLVVERFPGTSVVDVTHEIEGTLDAMRPGLAGVDIDTTVFRPATFIETALGNLSKRLALGLLLLALVLGAVLVGWRAALLCAAAILSSLAVAVLVLSLLGVSLNLIIVAGLVMALAIVIDDAVIDADGIRRRLRRDGPDGQREPASAAILASAVALRGPLMVATVIAVLSVLPVLVVGQVTGSFLRPLALSYALAILASMLVALTVTPALSLALSSGAAPGRLKSTPLRWLEARYTALLARLFHRPAPLYAAVALLLVAAVAVLPLLGGRPLVPTLQDRDLLIHWQAAPGTSLTEMNRITARATRELRTIPGVRDVGVHVGRASTSDMVVGVSEGDFWISIDPRADYDATATAVTRVAGAYPGLRPEVLTYPDQRLRQVAATGTQAPLVVRVYGNDYRVLGAKAQEIAQLIAGVDGVSGPSVKLPAQEPAVEVEVAVTKAASHGIKPGDIRRAAAHVLSGTIAGTLFEQQKVFDVVVWGVPAKRDSLTDIHQLLIDTPSGRQVRLDDVADVRIRPNPMDIKHDAVSRYVDVVADVRGRSLGSVTREVQGLLRQVTFPLEHHSEILGDFAQQQRDRRRTLSWFLAAAIATFFLLQACFASWRLASLLFVLLPVAMAGGVLAAALAGDAMSTVALMGLLAVLALAVRGGILQLRHYRDLELEGGVDAAVVVLGARQRFGPTVTAALATALALGPLLVLGGSAGLEIARPLAMVILGGLATTMLVNLFVLPILYLRFGGRRERAPSGSQHAPPARIPAQ
ncbi:MAG: efflux RND transporter permease subunit [Actinomycetes bacterium]